MRTIRDALWTTIVAVAAISVIAGDQTDGPAEWAVCALLVYPFSHLFWRAVRYRR